MKAERYREIMVRIMDDHSEEIKCPTNVVNSWMGEPRGHTNFTFPMTQVGLSTSTGTNLL
jgi:hypothetical protein